MLIPLADDPVAYHAAYAEYLRTSTKAEQLVEYIDESAPEILKSLKSPNDHVIRVLGIGSGIGLKDIHLLRQLRQLYPSNNIQITVVEPCQDHIDEYKSLLMQENFHGSVEFIWKLETSQEFRGEFIADKEALFDLIILMDSLYYEEELITPMRFYSEILNKNGVIIISIGNSHNGWHVLMKAFRDILPMKHSFGCDDIHAVLDQLNLIYNVKKLDSYSPIQSVFDPQSEAGSVLLDMTTHVANFRGTAPQHLQQEFLERIKKEDVTRHEEDGYYINMDFNVFNVYKS